MTDRNELWLADMDDNGWMMPPAPFWKTLPIIRHFRAAYYAYRVHEHETFWGRIGMVPSGYDRWVLYGIRRGYDRQHDA